MRWPVPPQSPKRRLVQLALPLDRVGGRHRGGQLVKEGLGFVDGEHKVVPHTGIVVVVVVIRTGGTATKGAAGGAEAGSGDRASTVTVNLGSGGRPVVSDNNWRSYTACRAPNVVTADLGVFPALSWADSTLLARALGSRSRSSKKHSGTLRHATGKCKCPIVVRARPRGRCASAHRGEMVCSIRSGLARLRKQNPAIGFAVLAVFARDAIVSESHARSGTLGSWRVVDVDCRSTALLLLPPSHPRVDFGGQDIGSGVRLRCADCWLVVVSSRMVVAGSSYRCDDLQPTRTQQ